VLLILATPGCGCEPETGEINPGGRQDFRGQVSAVLAKSIAEVDEVEVEDEFGEVKRFKVSQRVDILPQDLEEHRNNRWPVTVVYVSQCDELVAWDILD